jgi:uncharacterized protein DUF551
MNWISVKDKLPSEDEWCILALGDLQTVTFGVLMGGKWFNPDLNYHLITEVTHWMALPEPPIVAADSPIDS